MTPELFPQFSEIFPEPLLLLTSDGRILDLNRAAGLLLGLEHGSGRGRELIEFVEETRAELRLYLERCSGSQMTQGLLRFRGGGGAASPFACEAVRTAPGNPESRAPLLLRVQPTPPDLERLIRKMETRLARTQRIASLGDWEHDLSSTAPIEWSDETYRIFGVTRGEFQPTEESFYSMVHPEDRAAVQRAYREAISTRKLYASEHRILRADGQVRHVIERAEIQYDEEGEPARAVGTVQDITGYKRLEEQLRQALKMQAVGRLAGGMAHDFNDLLTVIAGYGHQLLAEAGADDANRVAVEAILQAVEQAASLTRQLLVFSRRQRVEGEVIDLNALVAGMNRVLQRLIGEDVHLITALAPHLGHVKADRSQIEQVIVNLAINSRDAMPRGGRLIIETNNVELDASYVDEHFDVTPGSYAILSVTDSGCGMDRETLSHIFEPFFTTKPKGNGTGLGLSLVYGIVKQSGGHINVYSEPNEGTCFKVYLARTDEPPPAAPSSNSPDDRGTETILLVEDEDGIRAMVRKILGRSGYRIIEAAHGGDALTTCLAHEGRIDLLLTDVIMPHMGGPKLAEELATIHPEAKILYMSGYTDEAIHQHGALGDCAQLLQKPFTPRELLRKVRETLDQ